MKSLKSLGLTAMVVMSVIGLVITAAADPRLFKQLKLRYSTDGASWKHIPGNQVSGYKLKLNGDNETDFFIDVMSIKSSLSTGEYNFTLDNTTVPEGFYDYWKNERNVYDGCGGVWEPYMWEIITNETDREPICILKVYGNGTYWLIDGLHRLAPFLGDETFRVPGDYPLGTYTVYCDEIGETVRITFK